MSLDAEREAQDRQLLLEMFRDRFGPVTRLWKTGSFLDRKGIDYAVRLQDRRRFTMDLKTIHQGAIVYWKGPHDPSIILEVSSNVERNIPGPLLRESPYPDLVVWRFLDLPEELWPFAARPLRMALKENLTTWTRKYGLKTNQTATAPGFYTSSFLAVPFSVLRPAYGDCLMSSSEVFVNKTGIRAKAHVSRGNDI